MTCIYKNGSVEIWEVVEDYGSDFYVYGLTADPRICPSRGMAMELVAGL